MFEIYGSIYNSVACIPVQYTVMVEHSVMVCFSHKLNTAFLMYFNCLDLNGMHPVVYIYVKIYRE
jgi:hypothetical protein